MPGPVFLVLCGVVCLLLEGGGAAVAVESLPDGIVVVAQHQK